MGFRKAVLAIRPRTPVEIIEAADHEDSHSDEDHAKARAIGQTIKSYLRAARELLDGPYSNARGNVPLYMTEACRPIAFVCSDGILVRYDRKDNPDLSVYSSIVDLSVKDLAHALSESVVHVSAGPDDVPSESAGFTFSLSTQSPSAESTEIVRSRLVVVASLDRPARSDRTSTQAPMALASIGSEFDIVLHGEQLAEYGQGRKFLLRSRLKLPVGWEAIQIFPPYSDGHWDPSLAYQWAEREILAATVRKNLRDAEFRAIDPNVAARARMAALLDGLQRLLDKPEEPIHQFLRSNPELVCPSYVRVWSKLKMGAKTTDFVFRDASGEYLLVELESPSHLLFCDNGQEREPLTHARGQITEWLRYLQDNLSTVQRELGLDGISSSPRCLIVIGRSSTLTPEDGRRLTCIEAQIPRLKILTYDDLLANARAAVENTLGPIWDAGPRAEVYYLPRE